MSAVVDTSSIATAAHLLGDRAVRDEPLAPMTTYRVGGSAALFVRARTIDDLVAVAAARHATGLAVLVVGRGSNMLVADAGFVGIAVSISDLEGATADAITEPGAGGSIVTAGGGVLLPVLARRTAAAGFTGFEWAVGVPGSVGGAVKMNAGGHGSDIAACLVDADVVDLDAAVPVVVTVPVTELGLRFRGSDVGDAQIVTSARLRLQPGDRAASEATIKEIVRWRLDHQPGGQNCGSVFVNPVPGEVSAASLIDGLGLRGLRIGSATVSEKHANFIQAAEGGSAADVRAVIEEVRTRVAAGTGHLLRSEVRLVGFPDGDVS
ncbi:MAG: UDP-N-acetylmuramate dehydrogenase [Ilumatobacteraceae bacterium]